MAERSIRELLINVAQELNYKEYDAEVIPITTSGLNFTSNLYAVTLTSPQKENLKLFVKSAALTEGFRKTGLNQIYNTENKFYTDLAITYQKLQEKNNIKGNDRLFLTKFFGCSMEFLQETFVLEDLSQLGFENHNRLEAISWEYGANALEELAKLHALSFVYEKVYPVKHRKSLRDFRYELPFEKENFKDLWAKKVATALEFTRDDYKERLRRFLKKEGDSNVLEKYNRPFRCPVIAHGDYKTNNLMHRVRDDGKLQMAILDYQALRISSIPQDLIHFIFTSTDGQFRRQYLGQLLEHYYMSLGRVLDSHGVDIDDVYKREDFEYEMKMVLPYGIAVAIMNLSVVLVQEAPVIGRMSLRDVAMRPAALYRERLNDILTDFVEWRLL